MKLLKNSTLIVVVSAIATVTITNYPRNSERVILAGIESETEAAKSYILQGASLERLNKLVNGVGGVISREFPIISAVSAMLTMKQAEIIRDVTGVRIQSDRTVITSGKPQHLVSHPSITNSTSMNNHITEQTGADRLHDMNITGKGVTVAVVDSGSNMYGSSGKFLFHDSSKMQRVIIKYDAETQEERKVYNDDQNGHGTHVSGLIASGLLDTSSGKYNGIAPDVYLLSVKAFNARGISSYSKLLDALNWIFENRYKYKIRVVNMSLGEKGESHYWEDPINQAVMRLWDAGVVVVSSAGNNGEDMGITVPGNTPYIITVGAATDNASPNDMSDDRIATFSSKGPTYEGFVKPEVLAYGSQLASKVNLDYVSTKLNTSIYGKDYSEISGTSQAAAIVTGIVALMISNDPYLTPDDVKCRIMQTAIPANNGKIATYSPFQQGSGLVNAYRAVMSSATNCANRGLNIKQDLLGTNHFMGPAKIDDQGKYFIELADGTVFTEGMHWGDSDLNVNGIFWGDRVGLEGMFWSDADVTVNGIYWGDAGLALNGIFWGDTNIRLEALHWGATEMNLKGMYWSDTISLKSLNWNDSSTAVLGDLRAEQSMAVQYVDSYLAPIDPNIVIPISAEGWH